MLEDVLVKCRETEPSLEDANLACRRRKTEDFEENSLATGLRRWQMAGWEGHGWVKYRQ